MSVVTRIPTGLEMGHSSDDNGDDDEGHLHERFDHQDRLEQLILQSADRQVADAHEALRQREVDLKQERERTEEVLYNYNKQLESVRRLQASEQHAREVAEEQVHRNRVSLAEQESLRAELKDAQAQLKTVRNDLTETRSQESSIKDRLLTAQQAHTCLVNDLKAREVLGARQTRDNEHLKQQLQAYSEQCKQMQAKLDQANAQLRNAGIASRTQDGHALVIKRELSKTAEELSRADSEKNALLSRWQESLDAMSARDTVLYKVAERHRALEMELKKLQGIHDAVLGENEALAKMLAVKTEDARRSTDSLAETRQTLHTTRQEAEATARRLADLEAEHGRLLHEATAAREAHEEAATANSKGESTMQRRLRKELDDALEDNQRLKDRLHDEVASRRGLLLEVDSANKTVVDTEHQRARMENAQRQQRAQAIHAQVKFETAQADAEKLASSLMKERELVKDAHNAAHAEATSRIRAEHQRDQLQSTVAKLHEKTKNDAIQAALQEAGRRKEQVAAATTYEVVQLRRAATTALAKVVTTQQELESSRAEVASLTERLALSDASSKHMKGDGRKGHGQDSLSNKELRDLDSARQLRQANLRIGKLEAERIELMRKVGGSDAHGRIREEEARAAVSEMKHKLHRVVRNAAESKKMCDSSLQSRVSLEGRVMLVNERLDQKTEQLDKVLAKAAETEERLRIALKENKSLAKHAAASERSLAILQGHSRSRGGAPKSAGEARGGHGRSQQSDAPDLQQQLNRALTQLATERNDAMVMRGKLSQMVALQDRRQDARRIPVEVATRLVRAESLAVSLDQQLRDHQIAPDYSPRAGMQQSASPALVVALRDQQKPDRGEKEQPQQQHPQPPTGKPRQVHQSPRQRSSGPP